MDFIFPNYLYFFKKQEHSICVLLDIKCLKELWQIRVREAFPFLIAILSLISS